MIAAESIALALGGRRVGRGWMTRCPVHEDREPSLSIHATPEGRILFHCHAGCDQERVLRALRACGLWRQGRDIPIGRTLHLDTKAGEARSSLGRREAALAVWQSSVPPRGTLVEAYLASRRLDLPPSPRLRFHAGLYHPSGRTWPVMVALVTCGVDDSPLAVHRTFLAKNGSGKAPVGPEKMMLGPCRGGAVRLATPSEVLMVGEGIETCLAAMQGTGHPAWAALSTSGLRALQLPPEVRNVIVLADGDEPGEAAAQECAWRLQQEGRRVRIARPPRGLDFNDLLLGRMPPIQESST